MVGKWVLAVITSILIIGTLGLAQDVYAPSHQKPERITIDDISWNATAQVFEVSGTVQFGMAKAGEKADFILVTRITGTVNVIFSDSLVEFVDLQLQEPSQVASTLIDIPWDRNLGTFEGLADIMVVSQIQNSAGNAVAEAPAFEAQVLICPRDNPRCDPGR